jgi:hypothetical protein
MHASPAECRQYALTCVRLAQTLSTPRARDHFAKLARAWIKLADDLERGRAILDQEETEPAKQTG